MTDTGIRPSYDQYTGLNTFLTRYKDRLARLDGRFHFIVGPARTATSVSGFVMEGADRVFVLHEDNPVAHIGLHNFRDWYENHIELFRQSAVKAFTVRSIKGLDVPEDALGLDVYEALLEEYEVLVSKYALGPHGDYYWKVFFRNFARLHNHFAHSKYLLTYRRPHEILESMSRLPGLDRYKYEEALWGLSNTFDLLLYIARTYENVFFLNSREMGVAEVHALYDRFMPGHAIRKDLYRAEETKQGNADLPDEIIRSDQFAHCMFLYDQLEYLRHRQEARAATAG